MVFVDIKLIALPHFLQHKNRGLLVDCSSEGRNKQVCRFVIANILFLHSTKEESCKYHFRNDSAKEINRRSANCEADTLIISPSHRHFGNNVSFYLLFYAAYCNHRSEHIYSGVKSIAI